MRNQTSEFRYELLVCAAPIPRANRREPPTGLLSSHPPFSSAAFPFALVSGEAVRSLTKANFSQPGESFCGETCARSGSQRKTKRERVGRGGGRRVKGDKGTKGRRAASRKERLTVEISNRSPGE